MLTLGMLASHRGSNVLAVVEACRDGRLDARPGVESLSARVLEREHAFLVETLQAIAAGRVQLDGLG